jgi:poly(3-hydroxybutyrate) depolymerase
VQLVWQQCRNGVPVVADFIAGFGHEWAGSVSGSGKKPGPEGLDFTEMAWQFFAAIK